MSKKDNSHKYEFCTVIQREMYDAELNKQQVDKIERIQDEGWELAGSATAYISNTNHPFLVIPFKRLKNKLHE